MMGGYLADWRMMTGDDKAGWTGNEAPCGEELGR